MKQVLVGCSNDEMENSEERFNLTRYLDKELGEWVIHVHKCDDSHMMTAQYELYWRIREGIRYWSQFTESYFAENYSQEDDFIFYGNVEDIVNLIKKSEIKKYKIDLRGTFVGKSTIYDFICREEGVNFAPMVDETLGNEEVYLLYKDIIKEKYNLREENIYEGNNS